METAFFFCPKTKIIFKLKVYVRSSRSVITYIKTAFQEFHLQ